MITQTTAEVKISTCTATTSLQEYNAQVLLGRNQYWAMWIKCLAQEHMVRAGVESTNFLSWIWRFTTEPERFANKIKVTVGFFLLYVAHIPTQFISNSCYLKPNFSGPFEFEIMRPYSGYWRHVVIHSQTVWMWNKRQKDCLLETKNTGRIRK